MKKRITILFLLLIIQQIQSQEVTDFTIGTIFEMESKVLEERRAYTVSLPASYEGDDFYIDKHYPILILLDGERLFHLASGMVQTMSSGGIEQIPEMIIVGVRNADRNRDLLPGQSNNGLEPEQGSSVFRRFLEEELIPEIENRYRTNSCKILVGHSFGGAFVVESFLEESPFNGYLAIDPSLWWDDGILNKRAKEILAKKEVCNNSLYISQANNPFNEGLESGRLGKAIQEFKRTIEQTSIEDLRVYFDFFEKEDHYSVPLISMYQGLQYIFEGYKYPLNEIAGKGTKEIKDHYQRISSRLGGDLLPPGKLLNQVGLFLINSEDQIEAGIEILKMNMDNYSNSYIPHKSLGEAYRLHENRALALEHYKISLALNPLNEEARTIIKELEKE